MSALSFADLLSGHAAPGARLTVGGEELVLKRVLRYLPCRRLVTQARWEGQQVVAKFFAPTRKDSREWRREVDNLQYLAARGIAVPQILKARALSAGCFLLLEYIDGRTATELVNEARDNASGQALVMELFRWMREIHARGCLQRDIHPGNFLRYENRWYLLDAGRCRVGTNVSAGTGLRNLAWLLAQFPPKLTPDIKDLAPQGGDLPAGRLQRLIQRARRTRYRRMLAKTERDCTEFAEVRTSAFRGMVRREARESLTELISRLDCGEVPEAQVLKAGNSATVWQDPEHGWVIKRYNPKSLPQRFLRQYGLSRARRSWRAGHYLSWIGIDTPRPIAFLEERHGLIRARAWYISASVRGESLRRPVSGLDDPERVAALVAGIFQLLHEFRLSHGDMKSSNLILDQERLWLIDLDAVRFHLTSRGAELALRRDVERLLRNWPEGPVREALYRHLPSAFLP